MPAGDPTERHRPAHARRSGLSRETEDRLATLGSQLPPLGDDDERALEAERRTYASHRLRWMLGAFVAAAVVVVLCAQWVRPLPSAAVSTVARSIRLPGSVPRLPWPTSGQAAVGVVGVGTLGQDHGAQREPIAGLAAVLASYVVLRDHPLADGAPGPTITVTPADAAADALGSALELSEIPIHAGETLTELQALDGLLVGSGADMATVLANWDAGSMASFTARMNAAARTLGLRATRITDPTGVAASTVSSASDLVRLGEAAMGIPAFAAIVGQGEDAPPGDQVVYSLNFDLGRDGIVGIKTGSDAAAGGCYLFAATKTVGGHPVTVVGAVLGQEGASPNTSAVDAGDALVRAAFEATGAQLLAPADKVVGQVTSPWGASSAVVAARPLFVVGWPGMAVALDAHTRTLATTVQGGTDVGSLSVDEGGVRSTDVLRTVGTLAGPSPFWRLTRA